jgi:diguanylate cyclase (GGDEF)-like protein/PAS domain S-box-containing protein
MELKGRQHLFRPYQWVVATIGAPVIIFSAYFLQLERLDLGFLLLALATIVVSSRIAIRIPGVNTHITVSDTFIFITLLLYGGEAAILVAAAEGCCSSLRISRKPVTIFFNIAVMGLSTCAATWALRLCFGHIPELRTQSFSAIFAVAICVMGLLQYISNTGLVAVGLALKLGHPIWRTWRQHYLWTSVSYFAGASSAGIIALTLGSAMFYAALAIAPIIAIVYFTYRTYMNNIEASATQATQAKRHMQQLQESEERFRSAFDYAAIGMALVAPDGNWLEVNHSLCRIVGYSEERLLATDFQSVTHPEDLTATQDNIAQLLAGNIPTCQMEKRYVHILGHAIWVNQSISLVRDADNESARLIFQIQDITDRKRAEERLVHDAFHDALTGLPNRALFMDHLKLATDRAKRREAYHFAVLFMDLDRFKTINDSLGHMVGDQLLVAIARRLEKCLRPGDTVARLGGDEFTILLEEIGDLSEAIQVADRVQEEMSLPFTLSGHEVYTTVSIGVAPSMIGYTKPQDILRDADTAMYCAKSSGKARYEMFDQAMHAQAVDLLRLETDLRRAIDRQEFRLHYQPIVSLSTGRISGFEALVRWQHPERGCIQPDKFISLAEETDMILPIGKWVLTEACRQMREWQQQFPEHSSLSISVNLSCKQFRQPDLVEQVTHILQETGLDARSLKLEITESVVMENIDTAINMMKELRALGVQLSMDDFGTGYSSLSYLHRFPISTLKIDRSFVSRMDGNNENREIVRTIVMLARNLGMEVVAEGVEGETQLSQLVALECQYGQGYFFSRPATAESAAELLLDAHRNMLSRPRALILEAPPAVAVSELLLDLTGAELESVLTH